MNNTLTTEEAQCQGNCNDKVKCYGCKMCLDGNEINTMVNREMSDQYTVDEIAEILSTSREQKDVRIVVKMNPKFSFVSKEALRFIVTSKFLQVDDEIAESYYKVGKDNWAWTAANGGRSWGSGYVCWNVALKDNLSVQHFIDAIDKVNEGLDICKVIRVIDDTKSMECNTTHRSLYICRSSEFSMSALKDKIAAWNDMDCECPVLVKSMQGGEIQRQTFPDLKSTVTIAQKGKEVLLAVEAYGTCSPYSILAGITGKSIDKARQSWDIELVDTIKEVDSVGNDGRHLGFSLIKGEYTKCSLKETGKKLLYVLTR